VEGYKVNSKQGLVEGNSHLKKVEKQLKDSKQKNKLCENQLLQKQTEIQQLKTKLETRLTQEQKFTIKNKQQFEKHFGRQPRAAEDKYVSFMRIYEEQRERQDALVKGCEREVDRLNAALLEMENENYALSKGQLAPG
jgi:hypothetical protein